MKWTSNLTHFNVKSYFITKSSKLNAYSFPPGPTLGLGVLGVCLGSQLKEGPQLRAVYQICTQLVKGGPNLIV